MAYYKYKGTLAELFPDIAKEWHPTKNGDKTPNNITPGVGYRAWWLCDKGHEWAVSVSTRVNQKTGCPYCGNKKLLQGYNDLATVRPDIAKEWHPTRNGSKTPSGILWGTNTYYWWQCDKGHAWRQSPSIRSLMHTGCPKCAESLKTSFNEQALLYYMKQAYNEVEGNYILNGVEVDVFIKDYNIAIEYDGVYYHKKKIDKDRFKNKLLKDFIFIRIREDGLPILEDYGCYNIVTKWDVDSFNMTLNKLIEGLNLAGFITNEVKVDIYKDRVAIQNQLVYRDRENSLGKLYPNIAKEWHPTKNGVLTPYNVPSRSNKTVWWCCMYGHEWEDTVSARTRNNTKCTVCHKGVPKTIIHKKATPGVNDLKTLYPKLVSEWDYKKNNILPEEILGNSGKKVWWLCDAGHSYFTSPNKRHRGDGCNYCSNRKVLVGYNDLLSVFPNIAKEWHPTKNNELHPKDVVYSSDTKVWWRCNKGHEWETKVYNRTKLGRNCPYCSNQRILVEYNDLATIKPDIANDWDYDKNYPITPNKIHSGSGVKVWWKCSQGHSYESTIYRRTKQGCGCPYCSNQKVLEGYNDLATVRPDIAKDWDYDKNYPLKPTEVSKANTKKVWWRCSKCGVGFNNSPHNRCRSKGIYCKDCNKKYKEK